MIRELKLKKGMNLTSQVWRTTYLLNILMEPIIQEKFGPGGATFRILQIARPGSGGRINSISTPTLKLMASGMI